MTLKIAAQIDHTINFRRDSTFLLMQEADKRGYELFYYTSDKLFLDSNTPCALLNRVEISEYSFVVKEHLSMQLDDMDIILMRQDPPIDMRYITTTYILEKCKKATVLNDPQGVRNFPEKILNTQSLPTLITEDFDLIKKFYSMHKEIVLKPLYACGGTNVYYIDSDDQIQRLVDCIKTTYNAPLMAQKFHASILNGDKRVTMLDGRILDVFSRLPKQGDFKTNLCLGNKSIKASLTTDEKKLCEEIGEQLTTHGIILAGIDLIGGHVIEINVTSPTGLLDINTLYGTNVEKDCWDCFENKL